MIITKDNFLKKAEEGINKSCVEGKERDWISTSKLRKILAMVSDIYNDARRLSEEQLDEDMKSRVQYLKLHVIYEAGRDFKIVKPFIDNTKILQIIDEIGESKDQLITFCHYMEALVAYRKFKGKDRD